MKFNSETFKNISSSGISPVYSWIWNSEITKEIIEKQLNEMLSQGIRAIYIIPEPKEFRPHNMVTYMSPDYLTEEFFELVKYAVEYAETLRISMWLYDEGGWPSGKACGKVVEKLPQCRAKILAETELCVKCGEVISEGEYIAVFDKSFKRRTLPFRAEADEELFAYYVKTVNSDIPDLLDERAVDEFIENTYAGYRNGLGELFGNTATAMFTDEPILPYPFFTADTAEFETESGFDFAENIPSLFNHDINGNSAKFRIEYIDFCSKRFEKKFMKRLHEWCGENNIKFVGHMDGDDTPESYAKQVGNALRHLRNMDIPGVDVILRQIFPGNENTFFPRLASSAAMQTGKNNSLSESFAVYGDGLTFDEMRYVCNYQLVRGINIINIMSVTSGRDRYLAGQCRPHFVPELPMAQYMSEFNDYLSRMMYLCSMGRPDTETALYMPMRDVWAGNKTACEEYIELGRDLEKNQVYFDIIDDDFLEQCNVKENVLCMGFAEYKKIYLPKTEYISEKSKNVLADFRANGGEVLCGDYDRIVKCDNGNIRAMRRTDGDDKLYILFNESSHEVSAEIEFNESKKGYILDCTDGSARELEGHKTVFGFRSGEAYAVLFTNEPPKCGAEVIHTAGEPILINEFEKECVSCIKYDGGSFVYSNHDGEQAFSGMVCYSAYFDFDNAYDAVIDLGEVYYAATVKVNGTEVKKLIMSPYRTVIDKSLLKERNKLEITVSNTAANALLSADYENAEQSAIGPYHGTTLDFEKESIKQGISEVKIYKRGV